MKITLPKIFEDRMKELLGEEFEDYLATFQSQHYAGLRVNTLKVSPRTYETLTPIELKRVPFIKNGYYYSEEEQPSKHPYYYAGLYYLQEPSAMTPASLLPVLPGDKVLDLCAAPGGKSTELAAKLKGKGLLVANDISNSRAKALLKNIELFGVRNAIVVSESPDKLAEKFNNYFDKILVDAPCSGEGMFRKTSAIIKNWEEYGVDYYNKLQTEIILTASKMLKPGGYLLYSTCTFSPEENEATIKYLLDNVPEMELVPAIPEPFATQEEYATLHVEDRERLKQMHEDPNVNYDGFDFGKPSWIEDGMDQLKHSLRLWPHHIGGEGHFVALLRKKEDNSNTSYNKFIPNYKQEISVEAKEFFEHITLDIDRKNIMVLEDRLYLLPDGIVDMKGLRILRSGLLLGEVKKHRFEPSQALANALTMEEFDNVYNLDSKDGDVLRYLKCESIEIKKPCKDGWLLICVDGFPLGFGKYNKGNFKNKYFPGWRLM